VNSAWYFVKFHGSPQQMTVNFTADSKLKENGLSVQNIKYTVICLC